MFLKQYLIIFIFVSIFFSIFSALSIAGTENDIPTIPSIPTQSGNKWILNICNFSKANKIGVAYVYLDGKDLVSRGWMLIPKGECVNKKNLPIADSTIYICATEIDGKMKWTGSSEFCISTKGPYFVINNSDKCIDGKTKVKFIKVNIGLVPGAAIVLRDNTHRQLRFWGPACSIMPDSKESKK